MQSLEEVGLTNSIGSRHKYDSGNESEFELWVGAEVSKRDVSDDQPANLIGMIR
jgi:hypothetical protein